MYNLTMAYNPIEQILVVKAEWVNQFCPEGFSTNIHPDFLAELPSQSFFMLREEAEKDPGFRQVIPYVLVHYGDKYLTVTRHQTQGETRLHNKVSIGIGGHINPVDGRQEDLLDAGLRRELSEELATNDPPSLANLKLIGVICDNTDEVSQVHLGVVMLWDVIEPVSIREMDKMDGQYLTLVEISLQRERLENWSRLVWGMLKTPDQKSIHA